jgi:HEAT repeat protein
VTLLRATDPATRVQTLERAQTLAGGERAALGRTLRGELAASARASNNPPAQAITVWFIRQVLALLSDSRSAVRTDAARLLAAMMGGGVRQLAAEAGDTVALAPAVAAAVELAGGRALAETDRALGETRVLALAEMLEAGLRPLAVGLRALQGVEEEALGPLSSALRDRSPRVRRSLVEVLTAMGGERAISLLTPLLQDPSADLRSQAVRALGNLKAEGAVAQIAQLLRDRVGEVRAAAASALAEMEAKTLCSAILEALGEESRRDDSFEGARASMIEAAVRLSDGGLPALSRALASLPRPIARRLASALESSETIEGWLARSDWKGLEDLLAALLASAAELGVSGSLLHGLESTEEWVRMQAAAALGYSREPAALVATANLLSDPDPKVRTQAVVSIARHAEPPALPPLGAAASDPDAAVRLAGVTGLRDTLTARASWHSEALPADFDLPAALADAQRALLACARDSSREVRAAAASGLAFFETLEAASTLVDLSLRDEEVEVREAARASFADCPFPQKQRLLATALEDADPARRARAVAVLAQVGGAESASQVVGALSDEAGEVRTAALSGLAKVDATQVSAELARHLKSPDPQVRAGVAQLLGRAGSSLVIEALVQALSDPEEEVRVSALGALAGFGRAVRRHQSAMMARRSDPSERVREAAAAALGQLRATWSEVAEATALFRHGPLSPSAAAAIVEMAAAGDLDLLLRSAGGQQSDEAIARHLSEAGGDKLSAVLGALRKAPEQDQARFASSLASALRQGLPADPFLAQLKALDSEARLMAVEIAGRLGTAEAVEALIAVLQRDPLADVRSRAAAALAETPVEAAEEALRQALREDPNTVVRRVASRALDRGREGADEPPLLPESAEGAAPGVPRPQGRDGGPSGLATAG